MSIFQIQSIETGDIDAVAKYLAIKTPGVYDEKNWRDIFQWIWKDNPYATGKTIGWRIMDESGSIRGVLGSIPVQCIVYNGTVDSFWATSWFVDEDARNRSLELFMRYVKQQGVLMSNTPNASVEQLLIKMFKYKRADSAWFHGSYLFPLKPLRGYITVKGGSFIKKSAVFAFGLLSKMAQSFAFRKVNPVNKITIEYIQSVSADTDQWFREFSKQYNCALVRNAEMYNWLFFHPLYSGKFKVLEVREENKIQGYLVFKKKYNAGGGFNYFELVDEAFLPLSGDSLLSIMTEAYRTINSLAVDESLLIMRSNEINAQVIFKKLYGRSIRKVEKTYYKANLLKQGDVPFLTSLDGDSIFF